ncbi:MAG: ATP-binding cassette domain-containing protein [Acidobacteria bacterium]|nr:ATP-binding cassette domain-containing protein [Acidobacteriota bacterium]
MSASENILHAAGLAKSYQSGRGQLEVLHDCSLTLAKHERVAIIGQSGVGKSTLLHLLAGLDRADRGSIRFGERRLDAMGEAELAAYRNQHVGMVFQFYHLLPEFTALENVMMPILIGRDISTAQHRAADLLEEVGLGERRHHFPSQMSGGERQRVAIARALASDPEILLADEPTGNLDHENGLRVMDIFAGLHERHRTAMVLVTHNPELVIGFDRVLNMEPGGHLAAA